ncbi:hypothetical protein LEN26_005629 [Aphanomyces euteiches]|nr:hypothetical protein AeMF1_016724 [Aphanomyces euteiches]KAH9137681.1 hypothetical protein LEN26_005629 [Aphanomyces euteiches]KAH9197919.1 hypothetical protein AeNC1_000100 [Aphanomyces euteiches]
MMLSKFEFTCARHIETWISKHSGFENGSLALRHGKNGWKEILATASNISNESTLYLMGASLPDRPCQRLMNTKLLFSIMSSTLAIATYKKFPHPCLTTSTYVFDPATSGGVTGEIRVDFLHQVEYAGARITVDLDVKNANWSALTKADGNCSGPVTTFKWHIHTKWDNNKVSSGFLEDCSLAKTGNHYDPEFACGPNSEHVNENACASIKPKYNCTPTTYKINPKSCEKGDLSGKLGAMTNNCGKISGTWFDPHYPAPTEAQPGWNFILHAVCGGYSPRFVCAKAAIYNN